MSQELSIAYSGEVFCAVGPEIFPGATMFGVSAPVNDVCIDMMCSQSVRALPSGLLDLTG